MIGPDPPPHPHPIGFVARTRRHYPPLADGPHTRALIRSSHEVALNPKVAGSIPAAHEIVGSWLSDLVARAARSIRLGVNGGVTARLVSRTPPHQRLGSVAGVKGWADVRGMTRSGREVLFLGWVSSTFRRSHGLAHQTHAMRPVGRASLFMAGWSGRRSRMTGAIGRRTRIAPTLS